MKTLSVNENNDMHAQNGLLVVAADLEATRQRCTQVMQTVRGEMIYALDQGIPFYQTVWTGSPNLLAFEAAARDALSEIPTVTGVSSFSSRISANVLTYEATINTIYGATIVNGSV